MAKLTLTPQQQAVVENRGHSILETDDSRSL